MAFNLSLRDLLNPVSDPPSPSSSAPAPQLEAPNPTANRPQHYHFPSQHPPQPYIDSRKYSHSHSTANANDNNDRNSDNGNDALGPSGAQDAANTLAFFASGGHSTTRSGSVVGGSFEISSVGTSSNYDGRRASSGTSELQVPQQDFHQYQPSSSSSSSSSYHLQRNLPAPPDLHYFHTHTHTNTQQYQDRTLPPISSTLPQRGAMAPALATPPECTSPILPPLDKAAYSRDRVEEAVLTNQCSSSTTSETTNTENSKAIQALSLPPTQYHDQYPETTGDTTESDSIAGAVEDEEGGDDEEDEEEIVEDNSGALPKARESKSSTSGQTKPSKPRKKQPKPKPKQISPSPSVAASRVQRSASPSTAGHTPKDSTSTAAPAKKRQMGKTLPPKKKGIAKPTKKKRKVEDEEQPDDTLYDWPESETRNAKSESPAVAESAYEGQELYCVCRKPDTGKWMIGCDGCDDWFHGECVGIDKELEEELIDKYFCPNCTDLNKGATSWKRKCRLPSCRKPAAVSESPPSKYCSDDHGIQFFEEQLKRATLTKSELATIVNAVECAFEFKSLGEKVPTPPLSEEEDNGRSFYDRYPEDRDRLCEIEKEKRDIGNKKAFITEKIQYLGFVKMRREWLIEELKAEAIASGELDPVKASNKKGAKALQAKFDICGYDSRLSWDDMEWEEWWSSLPSETKDFYLNPQAATSGKPQIDTRDKVCMKKKCGKHALWHRIKLDEIEMEERMWQERMVALKNEKKKIRERMKRRWYSTMDGTGKGRDGWVIADGEEDEDDDGISLRNTHLY